MFDLQQARLGRYEIRERIGVGGMARVYSALDTTLDRTVAIKVLHDHLTDDEALKERFEREAKIIASFNHPNIVQVYDFDVVMHGGNPVYYMVMPYVSGRTLRAIIEETARRSERLPRPRILKLIGDLSAALTYAHERGMVHRDVKPGNVLISENGSAILTDFGIARMLESNRLTQDGTSTGTPVYMSPEQAQGLPGDTRSDLYSLGVILYEMLTGHPPFMDDSNIGIMMKHINATVPSISADLGDQAHSLEAFFAKALAKNPDERFQSARAFVEMLQASFAFYDPEATAMLPSQAGMDAGIAFDRGARAPTTQSNADSAHLTNTTTKPQSTLTINIGLNPKTTNSLLLVIGIAIVAVIGALAVSIAGNPQNQPVATDVALDIETVPSMTGNFYFTSTFEVGDQSRAYWRTFENSGWTFTFTDNGKYELTNRIANTAATSIVIGAEGYENISLEMDAALSMDSAPASAYGIIFNYQDDDNYNVFAVDGLGRYSIWRRENAVWIELRDRDEAWTTNDAIRPKGEANMLLVSVINNTFTAYVNDRRVARVNDPTFGNGGIGIYYASDSDAATVSIDRFRVYSSVPSMTGQG